MKRTGLLILALGLSITVQPAQADWGANQRLTWNSTGSYAPDIAVDSGNAVHVVWYDSLPGPAAEIYYRRSTDGGSSWSVAQRLTSNSGESLFPAIAIDSNNTIHVVWGDDTPGDAQIFYRRSTDGGTTWSSARRLTWISGWSELPDIAIDSNNTIHVVCQTDAYTPDNREIYYMSSSDGGTTWSATKRLTWNSGHSEAPAIATDSSDAIHVVWHDDTPGTYEIYYKRSLDGGTTWSATKRLTWTASFYRYPDIAIDSSNAIHVVWEGYTSGNTEIYHKRSTDSGTTWSAAQRLTWISGGSYQPAIAIDSSKAIHVVWDDDTSGNPDLYHKKSADGGLTWSAAQRLTWTLGHSYAPAIAIDSGSIIHIAWQDDTPGNYEIYYKKGN